MTTPTAEQARQALVDAHTLTFTIDAALAALDLAQGGYPTSAVGASPLEAGPLTPCRDEQCTHVRPCPIHDDEPVELTTTERLALSPDKATNDHNQLRDQIRKSAHHLRIAARIAQSWAWAGLTPLEVRSRLVAIDHDIWCANCIRFGEHNPREANHTECSFCRVFRSDYGRPPSKAIWDARNARGGRIDVGTITRIHANHDAEVKAKRAAEKAAAKLEREQAKANA